MAGKSFCLFHSTMTRTSAARSSAELPRIASTVAAIDREQEDKDSGVVDIKNVNTKLDTKLVQFGSGRGVASVRRAKVLHDLHPRLLAGPFFTSVPCGRVAGAISRAARWSGVVMPGASLTFTLSLIHI